MTGTERLGYKAYKCNQCAWVHAALPIEVVSQQVGHDDYSKCFRCGAPAKAFVPAETGDAPTGSTIQGVYVPGVWDSFFLNGPTVSDDFHNERS
jgi:rubredoxin